MYLFLNDFSGITAADGADCITANGFAVACSVYKHGAVHARSRVGVRPFSAQWGD